MSKQQGAIHRFAEGLVFGFRPLVLILFVVMTAVMLYFAAQLRVDAGFKKQLPLNHEYMQTFLDYETEFGGANRVLVAVMAKDGNMFSKEFFNVMERVNDDVFFIEGVDRARVRSIFTPNTRFIEVVEGGFAGGNVIPGTFSPKSPGFSPTPGDFETIRSNIVKAGIVGRLVAKDFSGAMVWAELLEIDPGTGERLDYQRVAAELEEIREKYQDENIEIHIIGFAKIVGDIAEGAKSVIAFFGIAIVTTFILLFLYSRALMLTVWPIVCSLIAVAFQLGALRLAGFGIDPMNILTPFLVFAIGVSHGVQMINSWRSEVAEGAPDGLAAARKTFNRLLVPGSIALLSDCIGFITILFIEIQIIRELAITASIGVALIILTNMILLPILLSYTRPTRRMINSAPHKEPAAFWRGLARIALPVPAALAIVVGLVLAFFGYQKALDMQIGDSQQGVPELRPDSRYNLDSVAITDSFSLGVDVISVIAEAPPQGCTESYTVMETIDRFAWHMRNVEGVQQVITLPMVAKVINAGWNEGNIRWRVIPRDNYIMRQNLQNVETDTGLLNNDCSAMPIMIFTEDHKAETITRVVDAVKHFRQANGVFSVNFRIDNEMLDAASRADSDEAIQELNLRLATGNVGVMAATNERVKEAQIPMLVWVYLAIIILCLLTYRSPMATLCIVLPLALVSILANALMAYLGIGLKVNTLPVAALGVGIGVDYGIYIYSRMREYLDRGMSLYDAYAHALQVTGSAVMFTAVTLAVGVGTWIFSDLQFQADMGVLLAFMFIFNMIGAVLLLPALACWLLRPKARA